MATLLNEANAKFLTILVTAVLGILGLLFNLYEMQQSAALEARRPFLEKQLEVCFEATHAAASAAESIGGDVDADAVETFRTLYLGRMALVENRDVACAMTHVARAMNREIGSGPLDAKGVAEADADAADAAIRTCDDRELEAQQAALELAQACRRLIVTSWGADLPQTVRDPDD